MLKATGQLAPYVLSCYLLGFSTLPEWGSRAADQCPPPRNGHASPLDRLEARGRRRGRDQKLPVSVLKKELCGTSFIHPVLHRADIRTKMKMNRTRSSGAF